jgi:ectoine hydroxylase-related dioxygenase (phytanoyl-CoA dioxygenase family)
MLTETASQTHVADRQREELWQKGHVLLRGVASAAELARHRPAIVGAVERLSIENRSLEDRDTYGKAFLQITNLWEKNEDVKRFVFERKFGQVAADLLGVEKVRLYHDQALFKEPGGGHTPWHQDKYYWPLDTDRMVTMWMPLVDIDEEMGMITFASGSHTNGLIGSIEISDESEALYARHVSENRFPIDKASFMKAGDATFHLGWTIHSAGPNLSNKMREAMAIIYFADGAKVTEPRSTHQQADLDAWLPGLRAGDIADSHLNPILN